MKGVLTAICALALLGSATAKTFPNDLYYSHHPDLAVADASGSGYSRGRNSLYEGPQRYSYGEDAPTDYNDRRPYRANYGSNERKGSLVYNQDGSINWAETKSKKHKVAEVDEKGYLKFPIDGSRDNHVSGNGNSGNGNNVNNRISSTDPNNNNQQNNNDQYDGSYGNRNQGDYNSNGGNQGGNSNGGNQGSNSYGGNQGGNNYGGNQGSNNYGQESNSYGGNNQGSNSYNQGNNYGNQGSDNSQPANNYRTSQKYNAYRDDTKSNAGFAGGMRLAGAEPQDGYFRGTGTFYDLETRTGTCGKQHKNTEMVAALNAEQMGDSNSSNEKCGKEIEVVGPNGKTITVTVVDSCKTCESGGLDLSPAAYEELGDFSHGSIPIKWKFM